MTKINNVDLYIYLFIIKIININNIQKNSENIRKSN